MRYAIYFNPLLQSLGYGNDVESLPKNTEPILKLPKAVDVDFESRSIHLHPIAARVETTDPRRIRLPTIAQRDRPPDCAADPRPPTHGRCVELCALDCQLGV